MHTFFPRRRLLVPPRSLSLRLPVHVLSRLFAPARVAIARSRVGAATAMLLTLLQRTPAERIVTFAQDIGITSRCGDVLRAVALAGASIAAIDSLAGATTLDATVPSPATVTVGGNVTIGFTVLNTINIGSWKVTGTLPPGLMLTAREGGNTLTGPGTLDATTPGISDGYGGTSGGNATTTPILKGSPSTAGNYTFSLQAYELGGLRGLVSDTFNYTVNVTSAATAPTVSDPQSQTVSTGATVTLSVTIGGTPDPTLQWKKDGVAIGGATTSTLTLNSVTTADSGTYTAVATNSAGTATSHGAVIAVNQPVSTAPAFTLQPAAQTIATGATVVFNAAATGTGAISYRWQRNGSDVLGATSATLVVNNTAAADAGTYTVIATGPGGSTTSTAAALSVVTATGGDSGHLSNLSVRTNSGTGDQVLNVGFTVGGDGTSGTKPLLLRVTGPALAAFGVDGTMVDPTLTVQPLGSTTITASNDNWGGDTTIVNTSNAVGAFGIADTHSGDAALVTSLNAGAYTAIAAGKNNGAGIVLTEIYDATPSASFTAATPRLVNVSARARAGSGDAALIVGFAIAGSTSKTLLIRATGPALAAFGVPGTLVDPKLQVYILGGAKIYENDNWGGAATVSTVSNRVGAFGIADTASKDSVLLVTLPPGAYTAQVSGADNGTGIALVEVYEVP